MLERPLQELKNKEKDLKVRDFSKNMKPREQPQKQLEPKLQFRKLLPKLWKNKWLLL